MINTRTDLLHSATTDVILNVFYDVYNELGPGFLESVYRKAMCIALADAGLDAQAEAPIRVCFRGCEVGDFRADILVNDSVILELKTAQCLDRAHEAQLLNYLRATNIEVGLLLNFGPRPTFRRFVFENERKKIRVHPRESAVGVS